MRIINLLIVIIVLIFIVRAPDQAADAARTVWNAIVNIAYGLREFLLRVAS